MLYLYQKIGNFQTKEGVDWDKFYFIKNFRHRYVLDIDVLKTKYPEKSMDDPLEKEQVVMLVPHDGAGFEETLVFTSLEKAKRVWAFLENRDCVEFRELVFDIDLDAWIY
jgi:hypothetical protein